MSLVSIIVPVYNAEKFINDCVDSILAQSFTDFEVLLINDGSSDKSLEICNEYALRDRRVIVLSQENRGVSSVRNLGIKNAKGTLICFVDSDDLVSEQMLESLVAKQIQTDSDLVYCGFKKFRNEDNFVEEILPIAFSGEGFNLITKLNQNRKTLNLWCCLVKREIVFENSVFFFEGCRYGEDQEFIFKVLSHCDKVTSVNYPFYGYRLNDRGAILTKSLKHFDFPMAMVRSRDYMASRCSKSVLKSFDQYKIPDSIRYAIRFSVIKSINNNEIVNYIRKIGFRDRRNTLILYIPVFNISPYLYYQRLKSFLT